MLKKSKKHILSFVLVLLSSLLVITNVSAADYSTVNVITKSKEDFVELDEKLTKEDYQTRAIIVDLPGPLAYSGTISNHLLPDIIASREKKTFILNLMSLVMGVFSVPGLPEAGIPAGYMGVANSAAGLLAGNPMDRYNEAYYRGESVYYGAYYPTPQPGLTTVPFIYYSKTPLRYQWN